MSKTIYVPPQEHACSPGWTWRAGPGPAGPGRYGTPPSRSDHPKGAVWECDCGRTWVSRGPCRYCWAVHFRRESRRARRRRERRVQ